MDVAEYQAFVMGLEQRLQTLQSEYIAEQNEDAQLIGPLLAITMLVKSDLLPFARDRYEVIVKGPQWKIAADHILDLRKEVEHMLAGPIAFKPRKQG
ncbi:MAG: hypothetical protein CL679_02815 [Bermanella sp.]|nr:hypothetical protein [Bermanella sp.]